MSVSRPFLTHRTRRVSSWFSSSSPPSTRASTRASPPTRQSQALQNKTDAKISGYFLCNQQYALPVLQALCEVLRGPHLRPVTTQCSLYVMRYLLTNHVYGDMLPLSVFQDLADV